MPAAFSCAAISSPTATILIERSVLRAENAGSHQLCSASSYVSVVCVCMISTWGASLPTSTENGSGCIISPAMSAFESAVQLRTVAAPLCT